MVSEHFSSLEKVISIEHSQKVVLEHFSLFEKVVPIEHPRKVVLNWKKYEEENGDARETAETQRKTGEAHRKT